MAAHLPEDLQRLLQAATRAPEDVGPWEDLARAAARVDYAGLALEEEQVGALWRHLEADPGAAGLGALLLAARGLRPSAPDASSPALPPEVTRVRDAARMRRVAPEGQSPFYIDESWVTVGQYLGFLAASEGARPRDWPEEDPPAELPAVQLSHHEARAYARWAGATLPLENQWRRAWHPQAEPAAPVDPDRLPRDLRQVCPFRAQWDSAWAAPLEEARARTPGLGLVHEWTATCFEYPFVGSDAEYFEKLEARDGAGAVVVGRCAFRESQGIGRFHAGLNERYASVGFRLVVTLDGSPDPCRELEAAYQREAARRRQAEEDLQARRERLEAGRGSSSRAPSRGGRSSSAHPARASSSQSSWPARLRAMAWNYLAIPFAFAVVALAFGFLFAAFQAMTGR